MDCFFKFNGYVPKNHVCLRCDPLVRLFRSIGCNSKEASKYAKNALRASKMLDFTDSLRDEGLSRNSVVKAFKNLNILWLPKAVRKIVHLTNSVTKKMEHSDVQAETYLEAVSRLGGLIFEAIAEPSSQKKMIGAIGSKFAGAIVLNDMIKDLRDDIKNRNFNPLKKCDKDFIKHLKQRYIGKLTTFIDPVLRVNPLTPHQISFYPATRETDCFDCECCWI